jgi:hypothetical protein
MKRLIIILMCVFFATGCARVPFQETPLVPLESVDPHSVLENFQAGMPVNFQVLNSVVFEYNWRKFLGIGSVDIDRRDSQFKLVCLNPMGVKLFELSGDRNTIVTHFALDALMQYGDLPTAVGNDIRRIYFDMVPSATAQISRGKYRISFRQPAGSGEMEYVFAGKDRDLVEKSYYENDDLVWRVSYYEYREQNGKHYPQGIVLVNYQYGYQLTVRQKELYS